MDDPATAAPSRGRRLGQYLTLVGALGLIASIATIVTAGRMVTVFDDDLQASTEVTVQALDAATESVAVLESLLETIHQQTGPVVTALRDTAAGIQASAGAVDTATQLVGDEIPASLLSIEVLLQRVEAATTAVDLALRGLSQLPIGPDYDPEVRLDDAVADIRVELNAFASRLDDSSEDFVAVADALAEAPGDLRDVADAIEQLDEDLAVDDLIARYEATLAEARRVATDSLDNVDTGSDWLVAAVITMAIVFGLGQLGLIWLGRHLAAGVPRSTHRDDDLADPPAVDDVRDRNG